MPQDLTATDLQNYVTLLAEAEPASFGRLSLLRRIIAIAQIAASEAAYIQDKQLAQASTISSLISDI